MTDRPSVLIVGADGMIGGALAARFEQEGIRVHATRRDPAPDAIALDLQESDRWTDLPEVDAAVICAAIANLGDCERDSQGSRRINVDGTVELARRLTGRGAFCLFLSSDKVFDGTLPARRHDDRPAPVTEYGRQKADAEAAILRHGGYAAVLRLTKVLSPHTGLAAEWHDRLAAGGTITPYLDMYFAPVTARLVVDTIRRILGDRQPGIVHLSGAEDRTYADFARCLAAGLGADPGLVQPVATPDGPVRPPRFSTLDMSPEAARWGLRPPSLEETVGDLLGDAP